MGARTILMAVALVVAGASPAAAAERVLELALGRPDAVEIRNFAGEVRLSPTDGELTVRARITADDEALAGEVRLSSSESRGVLQVVVDYPSSVSRILYDGAEFRRLNASVDYQGRTIRVSSSRGDRLRVDLDIAVPANMRLRLRHVVGPVSAERIHGDLALAARFGSVRVADGAGRLLADTGSGRVEVSGFRGEVVADTGSGRVAIENVLGNVKADTGSGGVSLRGIDGDVLADTGSGSVSITDVRAGTVVADTGSGAVRLRDVSGSLKVDTGSGSVRGEGLVLGPELIVDTGSGGVSLAGDLGGVRRVDVDTGSGSVELRSSTPLSLRLDLSTGSGGIRVDLPALSQVESSRRRFRALAGDGDGTARISTGSGGIRIGGL
jgi:DUF4097 and DUF4098 domain-containing protein YvlB